jgi:hypothetical protein
MSEEQGVPAPDTSPPEEKEPQEESQEETSRKRAVMTVSAMR